VDRDVAPAAALAALDLPPYEGIVVVHGGASGMEPELLQSVRQFLIAGLAPLAEQRRLLVADGGTDVGVYRLFGEARQTVGGTFPLLGVAPLRFVTYPDCPIAGEECVPLNPNHSHFILVREGGFGTESDLLVGLLRAAPRRGVALVINGGDIVLREALAHARLGNSLITVRESGRVADQLADPTSPESAQLPPGTRLHVADVHAPAIFTQMVTHLLFEAGNG
jgi:hypothetical protein